MVRTEDIVLYARCEMRAEIVGYLKHQGWITSTDPEQIAHDIEQAKKSPKRKQQGTKEERLLRLAKVAVVYTFDFNITERNAAGGGAGFQLPWLANALDVGASGAIDLTRQGLREFGTEDRWGGLISNPAICNEQEANWRRPENIIHPLTGSIGIDRVARTFIKIDTQGGARDNFVDTLTFTTQANGSADAGLKLAPVPDQFRLASATFAVSASRIDIHKLTISLTFPRKDEPDPNEGVVRKDGDLNAPFTRPAEWRARYNLCVADARARENAFKKLRLEAPEVYCIRYADAFSPQTGLRAEQPQVVLQVAPQVVKPALQKNKPEGGGEGGGASILMLPSSRPLVRPNYTR